MVHCKYHGYILISQAPSLLTLKDTICSILMEGWSRSTHILVTVDSGALLLYFWSVLYFVHRSNESLMMRGRKQGLICQWIPKVLWTWISSNKYIPMSTRGYYLVSSCRQKKMCLLFGSKLGFLMRSILHNCVSLVVRMFRCGSK